jgi:mono/diheme cytochrome c family protein
MSFTETPPAKSSGRPRRTGLGIAAFIAIVLIGFVTWRLATRERDPLLPDVTPTAQLTARGEYLTRAADCAACHDAPGGKPFAGGVAFKLPFGTIYSTNITADRDTGIGTWSDDEFVRALHQGIAKDGRHLYPAFPYTSYTAMSRDDAVAIKAYLFSLPAVRAIPNPNELRFPFNQRWTLATWNLLFLDERRFRASPTRSVAQNRGAYLATALGHCGECHTPRTVAKNLNTRHAYGGATEAGWYAYNISSDHASGLGDWTDAQLQQFLSSGHAGGRGLAAGPMAEVVENSLRYLTSEDIKAMVAYLRSIPAQPAAAATSARRVAASDAVRGRRLFVQACAGCHLLNGEGRQSPWAALRGDHSARDAAGTNVLQVLAHGTQLETNQGLMSMHPYIAGYSDDELAAIGNFVIDQFGLRQGTITPEQVRAQRTVATNASESTILTR